MKLTIGVMGHPGRTQFLPPLWDKLQLEVRRLGLPEDTLQAFIDEDDEGFWVNARRAWEQAPADTTHRMVLQDDIVICQDFIASMIEAWSVRMSDDWCTVQAFTSTVEPVKHLQRGKHWFTTTSPTGPACSMPMPMVAEFMAWVDDGSELLPDSWGIHPRTKVKFLHEDYAIKTFCRLRGIRRWGMIPNLVQHVGGEVSLLGHTWSNMQKRRINISHVFIGENMSGLGVDWSLP